tara:strand:+ start:614 stop:808 length:195 start_codon:yes stop_codon:yes gene_type:complete
MRRAIFHKLSNKLPEKKVPVEREGGGLFISMILMSVCLCVVGRRNAISDGKKKLEKQIEKGHKQ